MMVATRSHVGSLSATLGSLLAGIVLLVPSLAAATTWTGNYAGVAQYTVYAFGTSHNIGDPAFGTTSYSSTTGYFAPWYWAKVHLTTVGNAQIWGAVGFWSPAFSYSTATVGTGSAKWNYSGQTDALIVCPSGTPAANASTNAWIGFGVFRTNSNQFGNPAYSNTTALLWSYSVTAGGPNCANGSWHHALSSTGVTLSRSGLSFVANTQYQVWAFALFEVDMTVSTGGFVDPACVSGEFHYAGGTAYCGGGSNPGGWFYLMDISVP